MFSIYVYYILRKQWRRIVIDEEKGIKDAFFSFLCEDDYIYLIPGFYPYIVVFDVVSEHTVKKIYVGDIYHKINYPYLCGGVVKKNGKIYMPFQPQGRMAILDEENDEIKDTVLDNNVKFFCNIIKGDGKILLLSDSGGIYELCGEGVSLIYKGKKKLKDREYRNPLMIRDKIYVFSRKCNRVEMFDMKNKEMKFEDVGEKKIAYVKTIDNGLVVVDKVGICYIYNQNDFLTGPYKYKLDIREYKNELLMLDYRRIPVVFEQINKPVESLIMHVMHTKCNGDCCEERQNKVGEEIYKNV